MDIWSSPVRRVLSGLVIPVAAGLWLSLCPMALAQVLFAGISSMEAHPSPDGSAQVINFQADLPFQYKKQILDNNTVFLRLYNARLAQNLITPEGAVNLLASGVVQSARLKTPTGIASAWEGIQEIILTGPGLGSRTIKVQGAEELPSPHVQTAPTSHVMMARVPTKGHKKTSHAKSLANADFSNLSALAANGVIRDANHPGPTAQLPTRQSIAESPRIELESAVARPTLQIAQGPQITEINNVSTGSRADESNYSEPGDAHDSNVPVDSGSRNTVYDSTQPAENQVMTALPRYTGGAKPIEAMMTDNQGHPVLIRPKSQPILEFAVGSAKNGGYNTLFQAEPDDQQQRIGQFLRDALAAYHSNQFGLAQKQVQQALMLDANNADLLAALAEIQLKLGQTSLAEQNYQKAHALSHEKYGARYAQVLTLTGNRQEAITVLEELYKQNPKQVQVAYMLGTLNEELGWTSRALTYLQQAAQLHPASADIQYNLGLAYELSGDREQAEKHYRQALGLNPTAPDVSKALARVRQGGT